VALQREEHGHDGQRSEHAAGHQHAPVGRVLADQRGMMISKASV
jgi:hypothetical protein